MDSKKLFFLLGPTASSKTKTSISICQKFNFEIINTDIFSCYKGKGIMTAKVSPSEQVLIKHHLISFLDLENSDFNLIDYKRLFQLTIDEIYSRNKVPFVIGGTNYYVEHSIFKKNSNDYDLKLRNNIRLRKENFKNKVVQDINTYKDKDFYRILEKTLEIIVNFENDLEKTEKNSVLSYEPSEEYTSILELYVKDMNKEEKYSILEYIDSNMKTKLHINDIRKVENSIIYYFKYFYEKSNENKLFKRELNIRNTYIIYFNIDKSIIESRIRTRLEEMIYKEGGLLEIFSLFDYFIGNQIKIDFQKGFLQAIGYKEYFNLYNKLKSNESQFKSLISCKTKQEIMEFINKNQLKKDFDDSFQRTFLNTFQYAKYQIKFIENRILPFIQKENLLIIDNPFEISDRIEVFIKECLKNSRSLSDEYCNNDFQLRNLAEKRKIFCEVCGVSILNEKEELDHVKSKNHKYNLNKNKEKK